MDRARRFGRLLGIVTQVVLQPGQTPAQLARALGVSERTLFRDLMELRRLGIDVSFNEGYQLQERLELSERQGADARTGASLPMVYEQQLRLLRGRFPADLAERAQAEVEASGPALLAGLLSAAVATVIAAGPASRSSAPGRADGAG
ncbi:MAG: HTH domain-containing protein, partial [Candidatus Dormibacteraceae bacterium]